MGHVVLTSRSALSSQITAANTIYEVREVHDLGGNKATPATLKMPANCTLKFDGGLIKNAVIVADNLFIEAEDDQKIFENVTIKGALKNWYVTPEWFGAVKDYNTKNQKPTDDTAPIQAALNCPSNVKFANNGGCYYTRGVLHIKNNYQTLFRDFSNVGTKGAPHGAIAFHPAADESILFNIDDGIHDIHFVGLRIITIGDLDPNKDSEPRRFRGIKISCKHNTADKDIAIKDCSFLGGKYQVDLTGRGCEITNNAFAACMGVIRANWDDQYQTGNHPAEAGQRAIRIQNNRMHSIAGTEQNPAIYIESGHAIGMVIQNNVWDNGRGVFLGANDELWNLLFTGNIVQLNALNVSSMLSLKGGIYNSIVSNNNFSNYRYYDKGAKAWKGYWANGNYPFEFCEIHKSCRNTIFENNQCLLTNCYGFLFTNCTVESSRFVGNYFSFFRDGQTTGISNAFYFSRNAKIGNTPLGLNNTVISGNMSWDTDEGKNTYLISSSDAFNAYNNVVEYNKAYKQDGTLVANPFGGNIKFYNSVVSLENGITTSNDMSNAIKSFNPWPVNNGGVMSWFDGTKWIDAMGYTSKKHSGTTSERPSLTSEDEGFPYYDKTLHKWLFYGASGWETFDGSSLK